jgi:hypothetical protein
MHLIEEEAVVESSGFWLWRKEITKKTGNWLLVLRFDRGPMTRVEKDVIVFHGEDEARHWFNDIYGQVFVVRQSHPTPPPPKGPTPPQGPKKITHISKKKHHLRLV